MKKNIWRVPLLLNGLSLLGLFMALLGDGWLDAACWGALTLSCASIAYYGLLKTNVEKNNATAGNKP